MFKAKFAIVSGFSNALAKLPVIYSLTELSSSSEIFSVLIFFISFNAAVIELSVTGLRASHEASNKPTSLSLAMRECAP